MRVLRVLTRPNVGGPTRQALALWRAHQELGVRTLLVTGRCEAAEPALDLDGLPRLERSQALAAGPRAEGVVELGAMRRGLAPWRDAQGRAALRALVRAFRPDVVHTHTSKAGWLGRRAAIEEGVGVVAHTFHGLVLRDHHGRVLSAALRALERGLARRTDLLFAVSPSCREELVELGVAPAARILVSPPAVDLRAFAENSRKGARARLGIGDDDCVLGFVGRLVPVKRPEHFAAVLAAIPEARGLVLGEGPMRRRLAGAPRLRLLGARFDVAELLAGLDVLVAPSRREGCPLAVVEAFAAGVPVVAYDVPGLRDLLGGWGAGILVPECEGPAGLARATRALLRDPGRRADLVRRARAGLWRFDPSSVARALLAGYERARAACERAAASR